MIFATAVRRYIDACNETLKKYGILQVQIKEEEHDFQGSIGSVRESLLQQVEPNIKQINDHSSLLCVIIGSANMSQFIYCFSNVFNPFLYLDNCAKYISANF
jgi:hypothetical protein